MWRAPLVRGVWHDFIFHVSGPQDANVGFVELWYDGKLVLPKTKARTTANTYLKLGLYRNNSIAKVGVLFHDGMVQGETLDDVLPPPPPPPVASTPPAQPGAPTASTPAPNPVPPATPTTSGTTLAAPSSSGSALSSATGSSGGCSTSGTAGFSALAALSAVGLLLRRRQAVPVKSRR